MRTLRAGTRRAMLLRSLAVQGSWNFRSLIGPGFAFALLPALRDLYDGDEARATEAARRHSGLFNCHPYVSPLALGAVATMEAAGEDPALIERFKTAIRGSLGTLGDRTVWAGWRPVCLLLAIALVLLGAAWWIAVGVFLGVYNLGHGAIRVWSLRLGLADGRRVAEKLRNTPISEAQRLLSTAGAFLVGLVLPLAASGGLVGTRLATGWIVAALAAAAVATRFGGRVRTPVVSLLLAATAVVILIEVLS